MKNTAVLASAPSATLRPRPGSQKRPISRERTDILRLDLAQYGLKYRPTLWSGPGRRPDCQSAACPRMWFKPDLAYVMCRCCTCSD